MSVQLAGSNVVVAAKQFNPSVFNPLWFARCGLFTDEDMGPGHVVGDGVVQVTSPQFNLLVVPNQLHFSPAESVANQQQLVEQKVGGIIEALPHTPYVAIGVNFVWHAHDEEVGIQQLGRELFFREDNRLYERFGVEDALFGGYLSRDFRGCREKLDIKPISTDESGRPDVLQLAFNFHRELTDGPNSVRQIREMLGRWDEFRAESGQIAESLRRRA